MRRALQLIGARRCIKQSCDQQDLPRAHRTSGQDDPLLMVSCKTLMGLAETGDGAPNHGELGLSRRRELVVRAGPGALQAEPQ